MRCGCFTRWERLTTARSTRRLFTNGDNDAFQSTRKNADTKLLLTGKSCSKDFRPESWNGKVNEVGMVFLFCGKSGKARAERLSLVLGRMKDLAETSIYTAGKLHRFIERVYLFEANANSCH
jgi:hypothetical protein